MMTKRYYMEYESDEITCGCNKHIYGNANSIKVAKQYISKCRNCYADRNPRNFKIYDIYADDDKAIVVYEEV